MRFGRRMWFSTSPDKENCSFKCRNQPRLCGVVKHLTRVSLHWTYACCVTSFFYSEFELHYKLFYIKNSYISKMENIHLTTAEHNVPTVCGWLYNICPYVCIHSVMWFENNENRLWQRGKHITTQQLPKSYIVSVFFFLGPSCGIRRICKHRVKIRAL